MNFKVAIKFIDKSKIKDKIDKKRINLEIKILKNTYHYNIIKLYQVIETKNTICMIMEYAEGGELFYYILEKKFLPEDEARKIFQQIIDAISYLHQVGICHRDLKLENILFATNKKNYIKIIDFGLSNLYLTGVDSDNPSLAFGADFLETPCGSPGYAPPEMILGCKYDGLLSDIWSTGIILFSMLCGCLPFDDPDEEKLYSKIIKGDFYFPPNINISEDAKILINKILVVNPRLRASIKDIRKDPWFLIDYKPIFGLYISIRDIPVSYEIIEEMEKFGFKKHEIVDNIKNNRHNKITTIYYLLVNKFRNEGKENVNDLLSNTFNQYLKEQDLKNTLIKKGEKPISLKIMTYKSKSLFNLREEENDNDKEEKVDLEYLKRLLEENNLINMEEKEEENNKNIENKEKKEENKDKKEEKKEINIKNQNDKVNIHPLKNKNERKNNNLNNINKIKGEEFKHNYISKKTKKNIYKKRDRHFRADNSLREKNIKFLCLGIIGLVDIKNRISNSTSINHQKRIMNNIFSKANKKIFSCNKKNISDNEESQKKVNSENFDKGNKKFCLKSKEKKEEKDKTFKKRDKKLDLQNPKISKLTLNKKIKNKIRININSISNNRINSSINKDILTAINNSNCKINKIKQLKDKNIRNIKNKNIQNRINFESFNQSLKSRNCLEMDLTNEIKTTREYKKKYILDSLSNSKYKSSKCKSFCSTIREKKFCFNLSKNKKNKRTKDNYFNIKINIMNSPVSTEGKVYPNHNYSLLNKENKNSKRKTKSNSVSKKKSKNKIKSYDIENKHIKYMNSKDSNIPLETEKVSVSNRRKIGSFLKKNNNDNTKYINYNKMKKLELNKLNIFKIRNKKINTDDINFHFNTIKSILTDRNNHINNLINNKKYDFIENNNLNKRKAKIFCKTLQKIIPSLKGLTIMEKKPLLKKSLINLIGGNNQNKDNEKRKNNIDIIQRMNKNKIIKRFDIKIKKDKELSKNNFKTHRTNIKSNNNLVTKIRKISPINYNSKLVSISNYSNIFDNNKEIFKQKKFNKMKKNNIKINPIKIKQIKSIKINNIQNYSIKPKTCRTLNNYDKIISNNYKNKCYEEYKNNFGFSTLNRESREKSLNNKIKVNSKKYKNFRNINELIIGILTKNKINVIKTEKNEYICKKGNNKIMLELKKSNNMDNYYLSINNINSSQKEFESFKKQIINIFNSN